MGKDKTNKDCLLSIFLHLPDIEYLPKRIKRREIVRQDEVIAVNEGYKLSCSLSRALDKHKAIPWAKGRMSKRLEYTPMLKVSPWA